MSARGGGGRYRGLSLKPPTICWLLRRLGCRYSRCGSIHACRCIPIPVRNLLSEHGSLGKGEYLRGTSPRVVLFAARRWIGGSVDRETSEILR